MHTYTSVELLPLHVGGKQVYLPDRTLFGKIGESLYSFVCDRSNGIDRPIDVENTGSAIICAQVDPTAVII